MHWGRFVDILPCVIYLNVSHPNFRSLNFKFEIEIQLHTSYKQVEMSYILGSGNVYMWHDRTCYLKLYICYKIIVD